MDERRSASAQRQARARALAQRLHEGAVQGARAGRQQEVSEVARLRRDIAELSRIAQEAAAEVTEVSSGCRCTWYGQ